MTKEYRINKDRCIGCGSCIISCPDGVILEDDGKSKVIDSKKVEECGGPSICPFGAIEEIEEK